MKKLWNRLHNEGATVMDTAPVIILVSFILYILGSLLGEPIAYFITIPLESDLRYMAYLYLWFIGVWIVFLLYFLITKKKYMFGVVGRGLKGNTFKNLMMGLLIGFCMNGLCILAAFLHGDIKLYFDSIKPLELIIMFVSVFIQSSGEELMYRGYMYHALRRSYRLPLVAILVNSIVFALMHLANPGITFMAVINIMLSGMVFSFMAYFFDSFWMACAAHAAWNYTQNIIFGLPNSGIVTRFSIFRLDAASAVNSFAYNTGFGVEGTVMALLVLATTCVMMVLIGTKRKVGD